MLFRKSKDLESMKETMMRDALYHRYTDIHDFIEDNADMVFTFIPYKRIYTPYEEDKKFSDESMFEDAIYGYITGAIDLGYDFLLEIKRVIIEDGIAEEIGIIEYLHLGDCKMRLYQELEEVI